MAEQWQTEKEAERFARLVMRWLGKGYKLRNAIREAALATGKYSLKKLSGYSQETGYRRGLKMMKRSDVQAALASYFGLAGFADKDIVEWHLKHVKGETTHETVTKDGQVVEVKDSPNYQALRDIEKMVWPQPATKVDIRQASVLEVFNRSATPAIATRKLKAVKPSEGNDG